MADPRVIPGETRDQTLGRVLDEQAEIMEAQGSTPARDVSTRRRLGTRAIATGVVGAVAGAVVGVVIGLVFWNVGIPLALAVLGFVLGMVITGERDDGRVTPGTGARTRG